jgi:hypothetical protein
MQKLSAEGVNLSGRGRAVKESVWSTSVQYGASTNVIKEALKGRDASKMSDADIVSAIQDYKSATIGSYFKSSTPKVQRDVLQRTKDEKKMLLSMAGSDKAPGVPTAAADPAFTLPTINLSTTINAQTNDPKELARLAAEENRKMLMRADAKKNIKAAVSVG